MKKADNLIKGKFILKEKGFGFVEPEDETIEDIFVLKEHVKNALNGDVVEVKITEAQAGSKRAAGKIVNVLERKKENIVGIYQKSKNFGFVVPDDKNFGTDIFIPKKRDLKAQNNQKVVVKIDKYPERGKSAEGRIIEVLGNINQAGVDMLSLIKEYDLPYEFPEQVQIEAQRIGMIIDKSEIPKRKDLRDRTTFTIDGEDAKDLDDAVFVEKLDNGNYILDVHIADVSHYVRAGSDINNEAVLRGTSIYMMDRVIPMLPVELSNGICSLNQDVDRLALSVTAEINSKGQVVSSDIYKSIINVNERMSYTDVYKIITNSDKAIAKKYNNYINDFKLMEELALILKNRRVKGGYLNLDIPESKITLDDNGKAVDVKPYSSNFANEIIEQFMLTANEVVAEKYYWLEYPFIYRVHEKPDIEKVKELNKFLFNFGYKIKIKDDEFHPTEFAKVIEEIKGKPEEKVILNLILRTLKLAKYDNKNLGHFGLGSKFYCHFTSPIRRYPDLFIHRVISEYMYANENKQNKLRKQAEKYAKSSSECEKIAQKVERESLDIKKAEYMEDKIGNEYQGVISSVTNFGIYVELPNTVEGLIRFDDLGDDYYIYNEDNKTLIGERTKVTYQIGDEIKVKVIEANKLLRRIGFKEMR